MAILKIAVLGNPVLRVPAEPVKNTQAPDIQRLIDDMVETMREYRGVGLAAPQVHRSLQIVTIEAEQEERSDKTGAPTILINPQITTVGDELEEDWEGCLSIPNLRGKVPRHKEIEVQAQDRRGRVVHLPARNFFARVIQHECDHLNATVFLDRMKSFETLSFLEEYARYWAPHEDDRE